VLTNGVAVTVALAIVIASGALDAVSVIKRVVNSVVRRDRSPATATGVYVTGLAAAGKLMIVIGAAGAGDRAAVTAGIALVVVAELLRLALLRTNSLAEYRDLIRSLFSAD